MKGIRVIWVLLGTAFISLSVNTLSVFACDVDLNGEVDRRDITLISGALAARESVSGPNDPRDANQDGRISIHDVSICRGLCTHSNCNSRPTAEAGADFMAIIGDTVTLDGSSSVDADGQGLFYSWLLASAPVGSAAILSDSTAARPRLAIDIEGDYYVELTVSDGAIQSVPDRVRITTATVNRAPTANAGADQSVPVGETVRLDGSLSSDMDGDHLGYQWQFIEMPSGSSAVLTGATTFNPSFVADVAGQYRVELVVEDGALVSNTDSVTIRTIPGNVAPIANAGPDQSVDPGVVVQLDGTGSSDPNGSLLRYRWSLISRPSGSGATLSTATIAQPTFIADVPGGEYVVQLIVNDGRLDSAPDTVVIAVTPGNSRPVADAGQDLAVFAGAPPVGVPAPLNGSGSFDPDGDPINYHWAITSRPFGSDPALAALEDSGAMLTNLNTDRAGSYVAQLIVDDGRLSSNPANDPNASVVVTAVNNRAPIAIADAPIDTIYNTETVQFIGSGSYDPDGCPVEYKWRLVHSPCFCGGAGGGQAGAIWYTGITLSNGAIADPVGSVISENGQFLGDYLFELNVREAAIPGDPRGCGEVTVPVTDEVTVRVVDGPVVTILDESVSENVPEPSVGSPHLTSQYITPSIEITGRVLRGETLTYTTVDGTARAGEDYTPISGTIQLPDDAAGASRAVTLPVILILGDENHEPDETFTIEISGPPSLRLSAPATITIIDDDPETDPADTAITLSPPQRQILTYAQSNLTVTLGSPAPAPDGMAISLTTTDSASVNVPATIHIAAGQSSAVVPLLAGSLAGVATITASYSGWTSGAADVEVRNRQGALTLQFPIIAPGRVATAILTLDQPAPGEIQGQNLGISFALDSANSSVATVPPAVFIPQGHTSGSFEVQGVADGASGITAMAPGFDISQTNIDVTSTRLISLGNALPDIGPSGTVSLPVSLAAPAAEDVTINLTSSVPGIATVTPASLVIPTGQTHPAENPQISGIGIGTAVITATAAGYAADSRDIRVTLDMAFDPATISINALRSQTLTLRLSHPAPPGGLAVELISDNPGVATLTSIVAPPCIVNSCAFIPAGQLTAIVAMNALTEGNTHLRAVASGVGSAEAGVTVLAAPRIRVNSSYTPGTLRVGEDLQVRLLVSLEDTPPAPVTLRATSSAPEVVAVAAAEAVLGTGTAEIQNVSATGYQYFWVHGLQQGASATVTFSAPGYSDTTMLIEVDPSGFVWYHYNADVSVPSGFSTNTSATNTTLWIQAVRLARNTLTVQAPEEVRGGLAPVSVPITPSPAGIGVLSPNPVLAAAVADGSGSNPPGYATQFDPVAGGTTTLTLGVPAGFDTPAISGTTGYYHRELLATVTAPRIQVDNSYTPGTLRVGEDLQLAIRVRLEADPDTDVLLTASSSDSNVVLVSSSETNLGTASATRTFTPANYNTQQLIWIQGIQQGLPATVTLSAPGYRDTVLDIVVDPSGFVTTTPDFSTLTTAADTTIILYAARLNPTSGTLAAVELQELRGGVTISVPVTSSDTAIGVIAISPVVVQAVADNAVSEAARTRLDPVGGTGSVVITIENPIGFDVPGTGGSYDRYVVGDVLSP